MSGLLEAREARTEAAPALQRLCLAGGGTGGHITPGLAILERALERWPDLEATFFRTRRSIEGQVLAAGHPAMEVRELDLPAPGGPTGWIRFARRCLRAESEVRAHLRRAPPDALVALGGYSCLPAILAARAEGVPLVLLEENCRPGRVVRRFARWARAIACPPPAVPELVRLSGGRARVVATGVPLRRQVLEARERRKERRASAPSTGGFGSPLTVLVAGGSQGARGLNQAIRRALPALRDLRGRISWIHLTGNADKEDMAEAYRKEGWEARLFGYTPELPLLLAEADLAVARAGGVTVWELAAVGVPAVLVPYPHHRDRHQLQNALALAGAGAARLVLEESLGPAALRGILEEVLFDERVRRGMEEAALAASRPDAADRVLDLVAAAAHPAARRGPALCGRQEAGP